jgi:signal transduction histidine kinase
MRNPPKSLLFPPISLAICRAIVEQHGSRISVHSTLGQGSAFTFTMPRTLT